MQTLHTIEHLKERLTGLWTVDATRITTKGNPIAGTGVLLARAIARGKAIYAEFALEVPGAEAYEEGEFWWIDARDRAVHLFCVTSREEGIEQIGAWRDETTLVLEGKNIRAGTPIPSILTFTWVSMDRIEVDRVDIVEGKKVPVSTFRMERQKELVPV